jgi:hypothetical protein
LDETGKSVDRPSRQEIGFIETFFQTIFEWTTVLRILCRSYIVTLFSRFVTNVKPKAAMLALLLVLLLVRNPMTVIADINFVEVHLRNRLRKQSYFLDIPQTYLAIAELTWL